MRNLCCPVSPQGLLLRTRRRAAGKGRRSRGSWLCFPRRKHQKNGRPKEFLERKTEEERKEENEIQRG